MKSTASKAFFLPWMRSVAFFLRYKVNPSSPAYPPRSPIEEHKKLGRKIILDGLLSSRSPFLDVLPSWMFLCRFLASPTRRLTSIVSDVKVDGTMV